MTIETLEQYRGIMSEIKALELEIDALYDPRKSPNGRQQSGGPGSAPSDPTGKNAMRIIELRRNCPSNWMSGLRLQPKRNNGLRL